MNETFIKLMLFFITTGISIQIILLIFFTFYLNKDFTIKLFLTLNTIILLVSLCIIVFYTNANSISINIQLLIITIAIYYKLNFVLFNLINAQVGALRIRIIGEIFKKRGLTIKNLKEKYSSNELINVRIQRLIKGRQVTKKGNRLFINSKFILAVFYFFFYLKLFFYRKAFDNN
jgi:hypothetical protein